MKDQKLTIIRAEIKLGGVTEQKLKDQQITTSRKYKFKTYRTHAGTLDTEISRLNGNKKQESGIRNMNKQGRSKNNQKHKRIVDELARTIGTVSTLNTLGN